MDIYKQRKTTRNSPISVGNNHYAVIDDRGILYMAGENNHGQLGDGTQKDAKIPIVIRSFTLGRRSPYGTSPTTDDLFKEQVTKKVISVSCGDDFTIAITEDGKTYGWGWNGNEFIDSTQERFLVPTLIPDLVDHKAVKVSCGEFGWGAILDDGSVYVSIDTLVDERYAKVTDRISLEDEIIDISVHSYHFAVVTKSGKLYFAGEDFDETAYVPAGIIGIEVGRNVGSVEPEHIFFPSKLGGMIPKIKQVSLSGQLTVLTEDGNVLIWNGGYLGLSYFFGDDPYQPDKPYPYPWRSL